MCHALTLSRRRALVRRGISAITAHVTVPSLSIRKVFFFVESDGTDFPSLLRAFVEFLLSKGGNDN